MAFYYLTKNRKLMGKSCEWFNEKYQSRRILPLKNLAPHFWNFICLWVQDVMSYSKFITSLIEEICFWLHRKMALAGIHHVCQNASFCHTGLLIRWNTIKTQVSFLLKNCSWYMYKLIPFFIWFDRSPCNRGGMKYLFVIPMKNTIWACQWLWMFPLATCLVSIVFKEV